MAEQDPGSYFKSEIKRLNYYNSQFLVEKDFNDEQLYHKEMRRLHNRALHTWGIVSGLQVEKVANECKVTVTPGIAIDRLGHEVVLAERPVTLKLDEFDTETPVFVTIRYKDVTDPADKDRSDTQTEGERYNRWTERPEVKASATDPGAAPEVLLAVVKLDGKLDGKKAVAEVSQAKRRYAGGRIGSSGDGREYGIHSDAAGAWHFFDCGTGADRLTIDEKGNVGIGTSPTAARLSLLTAPGPYEGSLLDLLVEGGRYKLSIRSKGVARDTVAYQFDLVNNLGRFDNFLVFDRGNVGVGVVEPKSRLAVGGMIHSESEGYKFPDGTTQATAASSEKIPAKNISAGTFGENAGGGVYTFPAAVYWGTNASRTELKHDASVAASRSGFFETNDPKNFYEGANNWQHLIEARHSNNANNYALQIAGGFFDQNLYVRKTNGSGTTAWSQFVLANSSGNVGIGISDDQNRLTVRVGEKLVALQGQYNSIGDGNRVLYAYPGTVVPSISPGDWVMLEGRERKEVESVQARESGTITLKSAYGPPGVTTTLYHVRPTTSLKCEQDGSNFIVRPEVPRGNSTVIENTGGGMLIINPSGGGVKFGGSIACGGKIGFKTYHGTYVNANADQSSMRQAPHFDIHEQFTIEMACSREFKENISDLSAVEALATLQHLNPVKYDYKGERTFRQNLGFIAEEMPDNLASADRRSISPFEVVPVLTRVAKEQQRTIDELRRSLRSLQEEVRRR